jgi:glycerol-3-phosphate dehydrogenase
MVSRDFAKMSSRLYDVLIVGGGIHGATISYHCAKAGLRSVVLEKQDFAAATSANSLKILHGGLRYLQHLNFKRMRHSICSRREMMALAPDLVKPLPCLMPLSGKGLKGKAVMRAALFANDCIGYDRNRLLPKDVHLPCGHVLGKEACIAAIPGIATDELCGAAVWYDGLGINTERMVLEYILGSIHYGGDAVNYAEVTSIAKHNDMYVLSVDDKLSEHSYQLKTKYLVNGAGPWFEECCGLRTKSSHAKQNWAMALNIVSRKKIFAKYAVALEGNRSYEDKDAIVKRGKRLYFFVPWRDKTMIGTEYEPCTEHPDMFRVDRESIQKMVDEVNAIYPAAELTYDDISFYQAGLVPMKTSGQDGDIQLEKNSLFRSHEDDGYERVLSVKGVKYTTAPHIAKEIVVELLKNLQPASERVTTPYTSVLRGSRNEFVVECMDDKVLEKEIRQMIEGEMACKLSDVVFRRTGLGTTECPAMETLQKVMDCMAGVLGWSADEKEEELEEVLKRYEPLTDRNS